MKEFISKIREKWQMIVSVTFIVTAIFFSITAFIIPKYSSEVSLIVIQKQSNYNVDAFSAAKSAEYLSDVLSRVIYTETFLNDVLAAPYEIKTEFSGSPEKRKKEWKKTVDINKINNTGILDVVVYSDSREEAERIAQSIVWSYEIRGHKYHGGGSRVKIELIDGPTTSEKPVKPNLLLNTLLGFFIGLVGSSCLAYFIDDFDLKIFKEETRNRKKDKKESLNKKKEEISNKIRELKEKFQIKKDKSQDNPKEKVEDSSGKEIKEESSVRVLNDKEVEELKKEENSYKDKGKEADFNRGIEKKADVPRNLPYLDYEPEKSVENGFVDIAELDKKNVDKEVENGDNNEPTEDEVKDRLNKLLKGDL